MCVLSRLGWRCAVCKIYEWRSKGLAVASQENERHEYKGKINFPFHIKRVGFITMNLLPIIFLQWRWQIVSGQDGKKYEAMTLP